MTPPEKSNARPHPFEAGGLLSTTCARPDCMQAPSSQTHLMPPDPLTPPEPRPRRPRTDAERHRIGLSRLRPLTDARPLTAEEEAKFRQSVAMLLPADDFALHWSNNAAARLLATLDEARALPSGDREAVWNEAVEGATRVIRREYPEAVAAIERAALATPAAEPAEPAGLDAAWLDAIPMPEWRDKPSYVHGWNTAMAAVRALLLPEARALPSTPSDREAALRPARQASPLDCEHGDWYRDTRDFTWCIDCGRWRDDVMLAATPTESAGLDTAAQAVLAAVEPVPLTAGMRRMPEVGANHATIIALRAALAARLGEPR